MNEVQMNDRVKMTGEIRQLGQEIREPTRVGAKDKGEKDCSNRKVLSLN